MHVFRKIIIASLVVTLFACSASSSGSPSSVSDVNDDVNTPKQEPQVTIIETAAKTMETELYQCEDFSMTIPKDWSVMSGGITIYHAIRVFDPSNPINQIFVMLKAQPFLHTEEGKAGWQLDYETTGRLTSKPMADAPVLYNPSTEGFYQTWPVYVDYIQPDITFATIELPRFDQFSVMETMPSVSPLQEYAIADELLRATFVQNGKTGEGMFSGSVVDFGVVPVWDGTLNNYVMGIVDGGYYMVYNIMAVTAEKDTLIEWEPLLSQCLSSLQYSESYVKATIEAGEAQVQSALEFSRTANQISDGIMDSWEKRNTSQDIISQKQSDATLGYERVYDTQTGDIYKADNGWYDTYQSMDGSRYQLVTDDNMYTQPISGYIPK